jgi:hypothetical protein
MVVESEANRGIEIPGTFLTLVCSDGENINAKGPEDIPRALFELHTWSVGSCDYSE